MSASETIEPPIRFPEFTEPWETKPIERILKRHSTPVDVEPETEYTQIGMRSHGKGIFHKNAVTGKSLGNKRVFWIHPDCLVMNIIFAWEQAVGKTTERESGLIASHRFPMYAPKDKQADIDFIVRFFLRPRGKHLLGLASPGGAGRNRTLGQKEFDKLKVVVPTLPEQRKIADFLTAVDGRIGQLIQKKALLEDTKKGVMQQLFTQAIRFKDDHGNDFPEWEEKKLGEVLTIGSGRDYKHLGEGDVPVYGSGGVMTYVDEALYEGESVGIGRKGTIDNPQFLQGAFWTVDTLFYTHSFKNVLPRFIFAVFQTINWKAHNEAGGVPSLSKRTIDKIPLSVPSLPEQTKIADLLSALDRKIESVATQITETQTFKRGLLQQMFV